MTQSVFSRDPHIAHFEREIRRLERELESPKCTRHPSNQRATTARIMEYRRLIEERERKLRRQSPTSPATPRPAVA